MTEYLTEQEQIEQLKNWIKQYGPAIIIGILIAGIALFGWRQWQQYRHKTLVHASGVYDEMLTMRAQNNAAATLVQSEKLQSHYPNTPYGQMAAFMLARSAVLKKDYAEAQKQLNWVLKHSNIPELRQIARIRLARVYLADQKPEEAIKALRKVDEKSFAGMINEVRGDAYLTMNNTNAAREAYKQALQEIPNAEVIRPLLQMKYDNLATQTPSSTS